MPRINGIGLVGAPYAMKVARTVLTGGKGSDNFKPLPTCIGRSALFSRICIHSKNPANVLSRD
ncbi:hypothetical protein CWS20_23400 [Cytobacillus horneckiae]|uniref:Uncharacterized protein n=1 Tax=Cytobacillus horneckiae TaxID=549687 RepID=A0A2N0ZAN5_9BACI|nr:hypothetical protein CWS20_23400 [Cytobacillus horneckiae]